MRRSTEGWSPQVYSNGTINLPKSPPDKVKARKPSSPFGTAESSSGSRNSDPARSGNHSTKKAVDRKNDSACMSNPGKGLIRWPVPIEDAVSPVKPEKGLMLDMRQNHGNAARHPIHVSSSSSSQARLEKEYENQQKLRKATLASSLGSGDWNKERNRRL
jgi:hypothetical protein